MRRKHYDDTINESMNTMKGGTIFGDYGTLLFSPFYIIMWNVNMNMWLKSSSRSVSSSYTLRCNQRIMKSWLSNNYRTMSTMMKCFLGVSLLCLGRAMWPQSHTWQRLSICRQNSVRIRLEILYIRKEHMLSGIMWGLVVVWLSWLSGRALEAQARGVLDLSPIGCRPFHFPLFSEGSIIYG